MCKITTSITLHSLRPSPHHHHLYLHQCHSLLSLSALILCLPQSIPTSPTINISQTITTTTATIISQASQPSHTHKPIIARTTPLYYHHLTFLCPPLISISITNTTTAILFYTWKKLNPNINNLLKATKSEENKQRQIWGCSQVHFPFWNVILLKYWLWAG